MRENCRQAKSGKIINHAACRDCKHVNRHPYEDFHLAKALDDGDAALLLHGMKEEGCEGMCKQHAPEELMRCVREQDLRLQQDNVPGT